MRIKILYFILGLLLFSCNTERSEINGIASINEMIRFSNANQISVILNCSPYTINRFFNNKTIPTKYALKEIRTLYNSYQTSINKSESLSQLEMKSKSGLITFYRYMKSHKLLFVIFICSSIILTVLLFLLLTFFAMHIHINDLLNSRKGSFSLDLSSKRFLIGIIIINSCLLLFIIFSSSNYYNDLSSSYEKSINKKWEIIVN